MISMIITLHLLPQPYLTFDDFTCKCAIGRAGVSATKREGDGTTPTGTFTLKHVFYRPDKLEAPKTTLPVTAITPDMGWCDEPTHPHYNKLVQLPFDASHEVLWRDDDIYDVVVEISHNSDPVIPYAGSAVFLHIARDNYEPTAGCIAMTKNDLLTLLEKADNTCGIYVTP